MPVSQRAVDSRVRATEERDDRNSLRPSEMHRAGVGTDEELAREQEFAHLREARIRCHDRLPSRKGERLGDE
ncbi:MAG TPA: hypothetical protein VGR38_08000 [Candidatus Polarisedimenticolia bacterium]|jgi:hypothetical protein|nr:hypothetical protein [Candidatus Polarisedimenticolia bacterium]